MTQPSLFVSHGAPDLVLGDAPARQFLAGLGKKLERPDAILIASAHHETDEVAVRAPARFRTWHDFGNFDRRLFERRYEPPGAADVAEEALRLLADAGLAPQRDASDLIDHGAWAPLSLMFPDADVPVAMVSIDPRRDAAWHERVGNALAPLRDRNVLIIGSGSISHNLHAIFAGPDEAGKASVEAFIAWLESRIAAGDAEGLLAAMDAAPDAAWNHPTDEHLLPLFFAFGAGGGGAGQRLHHSYTYDLLAMDVYEFAAA